MLPYALSNIHVHLLINDLTVRIFLFYLNRSMLSGLHCVVIQVLSNEFGYHLLKKLYIILLITYLPKTTTTCPSVSGVEWGLSRVDTHRESRNNKEAVRNKNPLPCSHKSIATFFTIPIFPCKVVNVMYAEDLNIA